MKHRQFRGPIDILQVSTMTAPRAQVKAIADIKSNRLSITVSGNIDSRSLEKLYTEIRFCVADLQPGFEVLSDISQCNLVYIAGLPIYKKIVDFLVTSKIGENIQIIQTQNIGSKQITTFSKAINSYTPLYAYSREEAEKRLVEIVPRDGIRLKLRHLFFEYTAPDGNGKANVTDISVSGCAVENASLPLAMATEVECLIVFSPHPPLIDQMRTKAVVVRVEANRFAVRFLDLDDAFKGQLYQRLAHESSRSCPLP